MSYRVGRADLMGPIDYAEWPVYEERIDAEEAARLESYNDTVIAVFDCNTESEIEAGEIVTLALYQVLYYKEKV